MKNMDYYETSNVKEFIMILNVAIILAAILLMTAMHLCHLEYVRFVKREALLALAEAKTGMYAQGWMHGMHDEKARQNEALDNIIASYVE